MNEQFAVALSFAGEDRSFVERVAAALKNAGVNVFYDEFEQASLWGKDLFQHLDEVYRKQSQYCVIFISRYYVEKIWAQHELKSAQARSLYEREEYILPVRLDDTEVPGVKPTVGYISGTTNTPERIADLVLQKLGTPARPEASRTGRLPRVPRVTPEAFDPVEQAPRIMEAIEECFDSKKNDLDGLGIRLSKSQSRGGTVLYRCMRGNDVLYYLQMRDDECLLGPGTITFLDGWGNPSVTGGATGHARMEWDGHKAQAVVRVSNYSLLDNPVGETFSLAEFVDQVWEKACRVMESLSR